MPRRLNFFTLLASAAGQNQRRTALRPQAY
jgi:hypothetical protein